MDGTDESRVVLSVTNDGVIAPEILPHLFDPFRGGPRDPARGEGLGLGLYIVQQLVLAHGGAIDVESGPRGRTTFRVSVPRRT
jgi:signal transduction histidine kinase